MVRISMMDMRWLAFKSALGLAIEYETKHSQMMMMMLLLFTGMIIISAGPFCVLVSTTP
jgi:hypothetical protein